MSHEPDRPEQYVCLNCQVVYAGSIHQKGDSYHFHPPTDCVGCNGPEWVEFESYVRRVDE